MAQSKLALPLFRRGFGRRDTEEYLRPQQDSTPGHHASHVPGQGGFSEEPQNDDVSVVGYFAHVPLN